MGVNEFLDKYNNRIKRIVITEQQIKERLDRQEKMNEKDEKRKADLEEKRKQSKEKEQFMYEKCRLCARECLVNRSAGELGFCGMSDKIYVARAARL